VTLSEGLSTKCQVNFVTFFTRKLMLKNIIDFLMDYIFWPSSFLVRFWFKLTLLFQTTLVLFHLASRFKSGVYITLMSTNSLPSCPLKLNFISLAWHDIKWHVTWEKGNRRICMFDVIYGRPPIFYFVIRTAKTIMCVSVVIYERPLVVNLFQFLFDMEDQKSKQFLLSLLRTLSFHLISEFKACNLLILGFQCPHF